MGMLQCVSRVWCIDWFGVIDVGDKENTIGGFAGSSAAACMALRQQVLNDNEKY